MCVVTWFDTATEETWQSEAAARDAKATVCETAGWLLRNDGDFVVVASTRQRPGPDTHDPYNSVTTIPGAAVYDIAFLD